MAAARMPPSPPKARSPGPRRWRACAGAVAAASLLAAAGCSDGGDAAAPTDSVRTASASRGGVEGAEVFSGSVARTTFSRVLEALAAGRYRVVASYWPAEFREETCRGAEDVARAIASARQDGGTPPSLRVAGVSDATSDPFPQATFTLVLGEPTSAPDDTAVITVGFVREEGAWRLAQPFPPEAVFYCNGGSAE